MRSCSKRQVEEFINTRSRDQLCSIVFDAMCALSWYGENFDTGKTQFFFDKIGLSRYIEFSEYEKSQKSEFLKRLKERNALYHTFQ